MSERDNIGALYDSVPASCSCPFDLAGWLADGPSVFICRPSSSSSRSLNVRVSIKRIKLPFVGGVECKVKVLDSFAAAAAFACHRSRLTD